jgi:hypothetical protein
VSRGLAPPPLLGYDDQRRRLWDAQVVRGYRRPGRGARTDLTRPREPAEDAAPTNALK